MKLYDFITVFFRKPGNHPGEKIDEKNWFPTFKIEIFAILLENKLL